MLMNLFSLHVNNIYFLCKQWLLVLSIFFSFCLSISKCSFACQCHDLHSFYAAALHVHWYSMSCSKFYFNRCHHPIKGLHPTSLFPCHLNVKPPPFQKLALMRRGCTLHHKCSGMQCCAKVYFFLSFWISIPGK